MDKNYNLTEDHTVRNIKTTNQDFNEIDNSPQIMLGTIIKPQHDSEKKKKKKLKLRLSIESLKDIKASAIVSVRSIYQKLVISNKSLVKKYWDVIMELILGYNVITTLYFLAYAYPGTSMLVIDYICWIFFIIDIGVTFFTELVTEKGKEIKRFSTIALNYITGWFIFDVVAIIPLAAGGYPQAEYLLRMFRLIKLPGVLDITDGTGLSFLLTYFNFGKREKDGKISYKFTTRIVASLVQLLITIIFIVYFLGCLWYWFQHLVNDDRYSSKTDSSNEGSFEYYYGLRSLSSEHVALRSSYFMLTTIATVGYGDFLPRNVYEMAFIAVIMLLGVTIFAFIMGNFNSAIAYYEEISNGNDQTGELNNWLENIERIHGKIDKVFRDEILNYFSYYFSRDRLKGLAKNYWETSSAEDLVAVSQDYVKNLPEETYYEILDTLFSDVLSKYRYYFGPGKFKYAILPYFQPRLYPAGTFIYKNNDSITDVVFLTEGSVSIGISLFGKHQTLLYCETGRTVLGDHNAITKTENKYDFYVEKTVESFVINSETFIGILENFFKSHKSNIMTIAARRELNLKRLLLDHLKRAGLDQFAINEVTNKYKSALRNNTAPKEFDENLIEKDLVNLNEASMRLDQQSRHILKLTETTEEFRKVQYEYLKKGL